MKRILSFGFALGAALGLSACVVQQPAQSNTASRPAYPAHVTATATSAPVAYSAPPPVVAAGCSATIAVAPVHTRAGCEIDERVSAQSTTVTFPCGGGPAQATFSDAAFGGSVTAEGAVELSLRTTFDFRDGCHWETKQEIRGVLASGALEYTYVERPLPGQQRCARGCEAAASVRVENLTR
ncbi:MAG: hypothetical protein U0326_37645 [Polyangiales bacterium]